ncbi:MAG TPA: glutathione S-transferase family protein [Acetobacteraceae bacterium]|nr:glutathione S-transferase family protein [Acetobacteraceae bacterium]
MPPDRTPRAVRRPLRDDGDRGIRARLHPRMAGRLRDTVATGRVRDRMRLFGMRMSGNCWKAGQILRLTEHKFDWVETDGNAGATRTPEFLAINPIGKVPTLVLDDGTVLAESNAILLHYAEGTPWLPPPGLARTRVHEWLFFEQYSHEPYIAVARNLIAWRHEAHLYPDRLAECSVRGAQALDVMERRLVANPWLVGEAPTIADLALFAYTHRADEAGFDLARWPGVLAWVGRITSLPGITTLPRPEPVEAASD